MCVCFSYYIECFSYCIAGEECRNMDMMADPLIQPLSEKMTFIERVANSITKRKRSTPQKFLGRLLSIHHLWVYNKQTLLNRKCNNGFCNIDAM